MGLSAAELASIQATIGALAPSAAGLLPNSATNSRTSATTTVRVEASTHEVTLPGLWRLLPLRRWTLTFPNGTDVAVGDRITVATFGTYAVCETTTPHSLSVSTVAEAYWLYDSTGAATYFPATHTSLQIRRDIYNNSTKQSVPTTLSGTVALYVEDISNALRVQGFSAEYGLQLICDGAVDLRDGDRLLGYTPGTTTQTPVVLVQHVAHHQMAGWDYKTALAKAVTP